VRILVRFLLLCSLLSPSLLLASEEPAAVHADAATAVASAATTMDLLLDRAIAQGLIAGGVVVIGNHEGILSTAARGKLNSTPGAPSLTDRTVFDLASLTKVIATAPAVMKLIDQGQVSLSDQLSRWFPELAQSPAGQITVLNLLTHTSGLDDFSLSSGQSIESAVRKAAAEKPYRSAVSHFHYADINFILLGELVHRVSGKTLDAFCRDQIYQPLGTRETMFLPPRDLADVAPTAGYESGVVQDPNARRLGGVAGHAGLFSSAYDLSRYARLILDGGTIDDRQILSREVVTRMTTPYLCGSGQIRRGLGWDMTSPFAAPKGSFFSDASFGHTGYSGSSIWIDPQQDLFVILLTRRSDYRNVHAFNQLRRDVSTVAAADFKVSGAGNSLAELTRINARLLEPVVLASASPERLVQIGHSSRHGRQHVSGGRGRFVSRASAQRLTRFARSAKSSKACKTGKAGRAPRHKRLARS